MVISAFWLFSPIDVIVTPHCITKLLSIPKNISIGKSCKRLVVFSFYYKWIFNYLDAGEESFCRRVSMKITERQYISVCNQFFDAI